MNALRQDDQGLIVVTGATGWVGRSVIDQLHQECPKPSLKQRLRAFGSRTGLLTQSNDVQVPVKPLEDLPRLAERERISALIHCAFLTPDHLADMGAQKFVDSNQAISDRVCETLKFNPKIRVVTFSSGAASLVERTGAAQATALYGQLKLEEERRLSALATTLVLRIYALTGRHIRRPRRYAIGDFLHHALTGQRIKIQSGKRVVRGYGHADAIAALAIRWILSEQSAPTDPLATVSHTLELGELAKTIAKIYGQPEPMIPIRSEDGEDAYTNSEVRFLDALERYNLSTLNLEDQIRDTAKAF